MRLARAVGIRKDALPARNIPIWLTIQADFGLKRNRGIIYKTNVKVDELHQPGEIYLKDRGTS
jgi:hypothetical protein